MHDIHNAAPTAQILATVYFGRQCPNGEYISQEAFDQFLSESVTPHFPGFTLAYCEGYWKGKSEPVTVLTVLLDDTGAGRATIRTIAEHYKTRFAQEAVAYSFAPCQFTLDCWPFGPVNAYHRPGKGY